MITLNLAIYEGDIEPIEFESVESMIEYLPELKRFPDVVWLATGELDSEIIVTESIDFIISCIKNGAWDTELPNFYIQEYGSYESAYGVAKDMKEINPLCYNKE